MTGTHFARVPVRAAGLRGLRGEDLRVLIAIASCADEDGRAFPGMGKIANLSNVRRSDVPRALTRLVAAGIIRREKRNNSGSTNVYAVVFDAGAVITGADSKDADSTDDAGVSAPVLRSVRTRADAILPDHYQTIDQRGASAPKRAPRKPLIEIAEDWKPSDADCSYAEQAGWSPRRIADEVPRFIDQHRKKDDRFADWHAAWRTWVRNGIKFDQERRQSALPYVNGHDADGESYAARQLRKLRPEESHA